MDHIYYFIFNQYFYHYLKHYIDSVFPLRTVALAEFDLK